MTTNGRSLHDGTGSHDQPVQRNACGGCECSTIEALFIELFDNCCSERRAQQIRAEICQCARCKERLSYEETIRYIVSRCDDSTRAPQTLRERITVEIRRSGSFHE